jgi:hypothetical protein
MSFPGPLHSLVEERGGCVCPQVVHGVQASPAVAIEEELEGVDHEHDHKEGDRNRQGHQVEENRSELGAKRIFCKRKRADYSFLPSQFVLSYFV